MQPGIYVALSAQIALQKRLDTIANNVSNTSTAGFRAEEVKFESVLSQVAPDPIAFATSGKTYLSRNAGELVRTDNLFDVAVDGDAWLAIQTPAGTVYTRDGRMRMTPTGDLQTLNGHPILDVGGAPLQLDPNGGPPRIARDGILTQNNRQVGAIGLFTIAENANLRRFENSGVIPDRPASGVVDFASTGMLQGFIERANVNPVSEITKLIMVQRAFEAVSNSLNAAESSMGDAIKTLGSTS